MNSIISHALIALSGVRGAERLISEHGIAHSPKLAQLYLQNSRALLVAEDFGYQWDSLRFEAVDSITNALVHAEFMDEFHTLNSIANADKALEDICAQATVAELARDAEARNWQLRADEPEKYGCEGWS